MWLVVDGSPLCLNRLWNQVLLSPMVSAIFLAMIMIKERKIHLSHGMLGNISHHLYHNGVVREVAQEIG